MTETRKTVNTLLIIALIASVGFNIYQWNDSATMHEEHSIQVDSLISARVDLEKDLNDTYAELNQYKGINNRLDSLLVLANNELDEKKVRIRSLMTRENSQAALNRKLSEEREALIRLRDSYLERIDSLLVENEQLKKERSDLETAVESLTKDLETTVSAASVLKAEYIKVNAYRKRSNDKLLETVMAKRTNRLDACFTLLENPIAKAGEKTIYLRIIEPGGKVLGSRSQGSSTFRKAGTEEDLLFTASKPINYNNQKMPECIGWEEAGNNLSSGTYLLEVYVDGTLSGAGSITLR